MNQHIRHARAEDQTNAAAWLLPGEASWVTGQVLPVVGGFTPLRPMLRPG